VSSVDHALRIATMLQLEGELTVSQVAERLDVARSTAHRLLAMLVYRDFAEQGEDRRYHAGPVLQRTPATPSDAALLRRVAVPRMQVLVAKVNETCNLQVRVGTEVRFLESVECDRPLRVGDRAVSADANGNLTHVAGPWGSRTFVWDARDRLQATTTDAGTTSFAYDALGRRTAREDRDGLMLFSYDITDVVEDVALTAERAYVRSTTPDELFAAGDVTPLVDGLGSILRVVDSDGRLRDALSYEPFGRTASTTATALRYGFTGREREGDDLYYYRARYYHAGLGRFVSEDPLGLAAGVNAYVYAFNDPVNGVDPSGLRTYVLHGVWPDRSAFEDFAASLRTADPHTRTLPWSGSLFGGVIPSTQAVATQLMHQILADLDADPLGAGEKLNLVGFSGGGLVSATLAEMLRARGVKVDTVVTMGTPAQSPVTTTVPSQTRLLNFVGIADPLVSLRLHPRGTNYLVLATHTARSYTENDAVLALVRRAIAR